MKNRTSGSSFTFYLLPFTFCLLLFTVSCSIPNLESPECIAARTPVKQFYSFHVGNEMKPSAENLKLREAFLTPRLKEEVLNRTEDKKDYFTQTDDYPKTFRVGECASAAPDKAFFQVVLFWKDDTRSEQRELNVEAVKQNEKWLINKVENKK